MPYANNKGANQTAELSSLISGALLFPAWTVTYISSYFILYIDLICISGVLWYFFLLTYKVNSHDESSSLRILSTVLVISSPEPLGSQGELIVYPSRWCPSVHPSTILSSETAWPIKAKFYVEPPWEVGTKVYINSLGHMTKMAAMPIYDKNLKKSSSPEPEFL